jgi:hypothetical protein
MPAEDVICLSLRMEGIIDPRLCEVDGEKERERVVLYMSIVLRYCTCRLTDRTASISHGAVDVSSRASPAVATTTTGTKTDIGRDGGGRSVPSNPSPKY